jgi:hypothetical protein
LLEVLKSRSDDIVVTLWFSHERYNVVQNNRNLIVEGSLKKLLTECHPSVYYTEADASAYNPNANSFTSLGRQWNLDQSALKDGPMIMIMHDGTGQIYWANGDTMIATILQTVNNYISQVESTYYNIQKLQCDIKLEYSEIDNFGRSDPWDVVDAPAPQPAVNEILKRVEPTPKPKPAAKAAPAPAPTPNQQKPKIKLSEPNKAFAFKGRR